MIYVIKLPGAGMIESTKNMNALPWLSYRDMRVVPDFFVDLFKFLNTFRDRAVFLVASGGTGSHLYMNLTKELGLPQSFIKEIGTQHVNLLQNIFIEFCSKCGYLVHNTLLPFEEIEQVISSGQKTIYFLKASSRFKSTDSLAAHVAEKVKSQELIFFKVGAPTFYAGFDRRTVIKKWKIDDLLNKATEFELASGSNYVIDSESAEIIKRSGIAAKIVSPDNYKFAFTKDESADITEIVI